MSAQRTMLSAGSLTNAAGFRSVICTITRFGQILRNGSVMHPADAQQRLAPRGERKQVQAAAVVRFKEPQDLLARCVFHAVQLQVRALQSVVGGAGQEEARIANQKALETFRRVDAAAQHHPNCDRDAAVAQQNARGWSAPVLGARLRARFALDSDGTYAASRSFSKMRSPACHTLPAPSVRTASWSRTFSRTAATVCGMVPV